jgi:DNA primase
MGRKYIAKDLLPVLKRIPDEIERDTYIKRLANELLVDESSIIAAIRNISLPKERRQEIKVDVSQPSHDLELEKNTLGLLAILPNYLDFAETILEPEDFTDKKTGIFYKNMLKYQHEKGDFSESKFLNFLNKEDSEAFKHYILAAETNFSDLDEEKRAEEIYFGVKRIKRSSLEKQKKALSLEIEELEKSNNKKGSALTLQKLSDVLAEEQRVS